MQANRWKLRLLNAVSFCVMGLALVLPVRTATAGTVSPKLTTQHGISFQFEDLFGKPSVVHLGFTHRPVVCPTTLNEVATYMNKLGNQADKINFVFVSVDPERDTAAILKDYIGYFDNRIIGVTGTVDGIAKLARRLGTKYAKRPSQDGGYAMSHVIFGYLLDREGKTLRTLYLGADSNPTIVLNELKDLIDR